MRCPRMLICAVSLWCGGSALLCGPARAQESGGVPTATPDPKVPIKMSLTSPLAAVEKPLRVQANWGKWLPVQVTLSNMGDPVSGQLRLRLFDANEPSVQASEAYTDIDLPTTSNKQFWLFGRAERHGLDSGEITFSGRGFRQVTAPFSLDLRATGTRIVLSVSATGERMNGFLGVKKPLEIALMKEIIAEQQRGGGQTPAQIMQNTELVRPLGVTHKNLPARWVGLQGADAVILQDFPFAELSAAQLDALRGYTAAGGALIVVGGANWDRLARSPLADMWPVTPTSAAPAGNEQRAAFLRRYIEPNLRDLKKVQLGDDLSGAPLMMMKSTLRPGARALWGSSSPIVAIRNYGAGQVVFLACDPNSPPFLGWRGIPWLWKEVFAHTLPPAGIEAANPSLATNDPNETSPTSSLLVAIKSVKQLKTPPVSTIAWFLALYVFFLVPVNYCLLRLFDKRELAWITVPVIVVAFSVMSYAAALRIKGSTLLARQTHIIQGSGTLNNTASGDQLARSDAMLWLFSPHKTSYEIQSEDARMVVADYLHAEADLEERVTLAQMSDEKSFEVEDAVVNQWAWRAFVGQSVVNLKGGVQVQTASGKPVVKNATPFDLRGVVVKWKGRLWACGDIKSGARATGTNSKRSDATGGQLTGDIAGASALERIFPDKGASMKQSATNALNLALSSPAGDSDALVTGWSLKPALGLSIADASPALENATLFVFNLE